VAYPGDGSTADGLMMSADQAMYASKRAGKDRVTTSGATVPATGRMVAISIEPGAKTPDGAAGRPGVASRG
jgi:hypothetical protein